jgi:hypothetical protein
MRGGDLELGLLDIKLAAASLVNRYASNFVGT